MKSFLNRRSAKLTNGASHLVAVEPETPPKAAPGNDAAHAASGGVVIDDGAPIGTETLAPRSPEAGTAARPVSTLHAVPAMPAHLSNRPVQVAEGASFEALAAADELATFRVFRSFDYVVTLLFHGPTLSYFATLHQDNTLWHALRAADLDSASAAFHHLEEQATRLADGETRLAQLAAQNAMLTKQIEQAETQAERLRVDLQRHTEQEHRVSARQHQVRKDVAQLEAQRIAAQAQLNKAHRTIHQLSVASNEGVPHLPSR
ncbi:hypothetical protein LMG28688_03258 [Paraburkholderia caffeinitolerans]|uniref:DUF2968 domain-containing protein n=1 Tax=Paraburkholderia caffeinitolerans TaxID=1723730 RepID=A0A6J5G460_9BURK|nr:DUF2968 domain-containing protein [Paraburkholderia caffeinitolerans]CAB3791187.1 hypothetical protein LMG28688_03258 [Paraburkholderia caffeinitolerans]